MEHRNAELTFEEIVVVVGGQNGNQNTNNTPRP